MILVLFTPNIVFIKLDSSYKLNKSFAKIILYKKAVQKTAFKQLTKLIQTNSFLN